MEECIQNIFYNQLSLKNYKYVFYLPKYNDNLRIELSTRINSVGGKVSFTMNTENIIVIDNFQDLRSSYIKQNISNKNFILIMENCKVKFHYEENSSNDYYSKCDIRNYQEFKKEDYDLYFSKQEKEKDIDKNSNKIQSKDNFDFYLRDFPEIINNIKVVKFICYKDLINVLDEVEPNTIELQYRHGLPRNIDFNALISVVNFNEPEGKRLNYFAFSKAKKDKHKRNTNNSNNELINSESKGGKIDSDKILDIYDLPIVDMTAETGFSIFMTKEEKKIIDNYLEKKKQKKHKGGDISNLEKFNLGSPEPRKDHSTCYICSHVKSQIHYQAINRNRELYKRMNYTFDRIEKFWTDEENRDNPNILKKLHIGDESSEDKWLNINTTDTISNLTSNLNNKFQCNENLTIIDNNACKDFYDDQGLAKNPAEQNKYNLLNINNKYTKAVDNFENQKKISEDKILIHNEQKDKASNAYVENACRLMNPFNNINNGNNESNQYLSNLINNIDLNKNRIIDSPMIKNKAEFSAEEYRKILNKNFKGNNYLKDRQGLDYSLEKKIIAKDIEQLNYERRQRNILTNYNINSTSLITSNFKSTENIEKNNNNNNNNNLKNSNNNLNTNNILASNNPKINQVSFNDKKLKKNSENDVHSTESHNRLNDNNKLTAYLRNTNLNLSVGIRDELLQKRNTINGMESINKVKSNNNSTSSLFQINILDLNKNKNTSISSKNISLISPNTNLSFSTINENSIRRNKILDLESQDKILHKKNKLNKYLMDKNNIIKEVDLESIVELKTNSKQDNDNITNNNHLSKILSLSKTIQSNINLSGLSNASIIKIEKEKQNDLIKRDNDLISKNILEKELSNISLITFSDEPIIFNLKNNFINTEREKTIDSRNLDSQQLNNFGNANPILIPTNNNTNKHNSIENNKKSILTMSQIEIYNSDEQIDIEHEKMDIDEEVKIENKNKNLSNEDSEKFHDVKSTNIIIQKNSLNIEKKTNNFCGNNIMNNNFLTNNQIIVNSKIIKENVIPKSSVQIMIELDNNKKYVNNEYSRVNTPHDYKTKIENITNKLDSDKKNKLNSNKSKNKVLRTSSGKNVNSSENNDSANIINKGNDGQSNNIINIIGFNKRINFDNVDDFHLNNNAKFININDENILKYNLDKTQNTRDFKFYCKTAQTFKNSKNENTGSERFDINTPTKHRYYNHKNNIQNESSGYITNVIIEENISASDCFENNKSKNFNNIAKSLNSKKNYISTPNSAKTGKWSLNLENKSNKQSSNSLKSYDYTGSIENATSLRKNLYQENCFKKNIEFGKKRKQGDREIKIIDAHKTDTRKKLEHDELKNKNNKLKNTEYQLIDDKYLPKMNLDNERRIFLENFKHQKNLFINRTKEDMNIIKEISKSERTRTYNYQSI